MTHGGRVKEARKHLDLTLEKFGEKLGVGKTAISNIENGNRNLTEQMMKAICREFRINETWLRTGTGEMFEQLTDQQKIMRYTAMLLKDKESVIANAIKNFIVTYEQLDDVSKRTLEDVAIKYLENTKRGPANTSPDNL